MKSFPTQVVRIADGGWAAARLSVDPRESHAWVDLPLLAVYVAQFVKLLLRRTVLEPNSLLPCDGYDLDVRG